MATEQTNSTTSGLQVKVSKHGSPRIAHLLQNTIFGTEGKLRYKQNEIAQRIKSQADVQFIEILKGNRVLGTVGMANRGVWHADDKMRTLYVRYLSVASPFKTKKRTGASKSTDKPKKKNGGLRERIADEITSHFEEPFLEDNKQGTFYAYVESANENSRNLCLSMGFVPARKVETLLFSRFNPSQKRTIQNIAEFEYDEVREKLKEFYHDHSFYFEDHLFSKGFYFVKKEMGHPVAGIRAIPVNWELVDYPGFEGWLMKDVLPFLPLTNRLFQPDKLKFLAFDYAWHDPDHEYLIPEMMSHCCSLFGINVGMIFGDSQSKLIKNLKSGNNLGFIHSVVGSVYADLMVRPINMDLTVPKVEEEKESDENEDVKTIENEEIAKEEPSDIEVNDESENELDEQKEPKNQEKEVKKEESKTDSTISEETNSDQNPDEESIKESRDNSEDVESDAEKSESEESEEDEDDEDTSFPFQLPVNEDLERWKKIVEKPIYVSALDMT